jgi:transcriptional regulator with XRE-family HTH domain
MRDSRGTTQRARSRSFDLEGFYATVDAERRARGLSWNAVAASAGVAASTLTRVGQGRSADIEALAALASWSGVSLDAFVRPSSGTAHDRGRASPIARVTAELRSAPELGKRESLAIAEIVAIAYERLKTP